MEDKRWHWMLLTAIAPIAWGSTYVVTRQILPADAPLWGGVLRALPAGLVLLLLVRRLPRGSWWWRSAVLGLLNVGGFFVLIYIAGTTLPSATASTLMSTSAAAMLLAGWPLLRQTPRVAAAIGAVAGIVGVAIMLGADASGADPIGVAASVAAMVASSLGFVLTVRWGADIPALTMASWQLVAGAVLLLPIAALVEGAPPALTREQVLGFGYVSLVATAGAYAAWFAGLRRLRAGVVGLIGLLNPLTGVGLGVLVGGEVFGLAQAVGLVIVVGGILLGVLPPRRRRPRIASVRVVAIESRT